MLTPILFAVLAAQAQVPTSPTVTASGLISKMLARYNGARSLSGAIRTTQTADSATVVTETSIAYERPSKIRLTQQQRGASIASDKLLVSDGNQFAYSKPPQLHDADKYLVEPVQPTGRKAQTIGELYWVVATSLPDRSPVLDALVGNSEDLKYFAKQLDKFQLLPNKETINGRSANVIEGDWRESETVLASGKFKLYLGDDGDLVRYVLIQKFGSPTRVPGVNGTLPPSQVEVTTTWDASVTVDVPVKPETFALKSL